MSADNGRGAPVESRKGEPEMRGEPTDVGATAEHDPGEAPESTRDAATQDGAIPAEMRVQGGLDKETVQRSIAVHKDQIRWCYEQHLSQDPDLQGDLLVRFGIAPDGLVSDAKVVTSSFENRFGIDDCVVRMIRRWKFPPPGDGKPVVVTCPFVLRPGGGG